uniref:MLA13uORF 2c n=1 Tax=Hordeum vulgare TaxID=4513 RepID=Q8GZC5_HORVU|nr:MLA13uORF 2c [Hordeum vulgare]
MLKYLINLRSIGAILTPLVRRRCVLLRREESRWAWSRSSKALIWQLVQGFTQFGLRYSSLYSSIYRLPAD